MLLIMLLFVAEGLLFMALSVPLIRRRVKPNPYYGFRVLKSVSDPKVWYDVNAYMGVLMFRAGVAIAVSALVLRLVPRITLTPYALGCATVVFLSIVLATWLGFRYLRTL